MRRDLGADLIGHKPVYVIDIGLYFWLARIRAFYMNIDAMEELQVEISAMERASKRRRFPLLRPQQIKECWVKLFFCKPAFMRNDYYHRACRVHVIIAIIRVQLPISSTLYAWI